jgi:hypothetical protein
MANMSTWGEGGRLGAAMFNVGFWIMNDEWGMEEGAEGGGRDV